MGSRGATGVDGTTGTAGFAGAAFSSKVERSATAPSGPRTITSPATIASMTAAPRWSPSLITSGRPPLALANRANLPTGLTTTPVSRGIGLAGSTKGPATLAGGRRLELNRGRARMSAVPAKAAFPPPEARAAMDVGGGGSGTAAPPLPSSPATLPTPSAIAPIKPAAASPKAGRATCPAPRMALERWSKLILQSGARGHGPNAVRLPLLSAANNRPLTTVGDMNTPPLSCCPLSQR